jgi:hypothetical protein
MPRRAHGGRLNSLAERDKARALSATGEQPGRARLPPSRGRMAKEVLFDPADKKKGIT